MKRPKKKSRSVKKKKKTGTAVSTAVKQPSVPATFNELIARAMNDPTFDPGKLEKMLEIRERDEQRRLAAEYDDEMMAVQREIEPIRANAENSSTYSRYVTLTVLDRYLRPIYTAHGFTVQFDTLPNEKPDFVTVVAHVSRKGVIRSHKIEMPADGKGARGGDVMSKTHAVGSAISYGQRYLYKMIFNIAVIGKDDDGNAAGAAVISAAQLQSLVKECEDQGANEAGLCSRLKIKELANLPQSRFQEAMFMLVERRRAMTVGSDAATAATAK